MTNTVPSSVSSQIPADVILQTPQAAAPVSRGVAPGVTLTASGVASDVDISEKVLNKEELFEQIREDLGLELAEFAMIPQVEHFDYSGARWKMNDIVPGRTDLLVFTIHFGAQGDQLEDHVPADVRVFVRPKSAGNAKDREWGMYTFNRSSSLGASFMKMPQATWVDMVANEFQELGESLGIIDDEGEDGDEGDDEDEEGDEE